LNKNAYIIIAVTGKNFCSASSDAIALVVSNPVRYSVVGVVGYILAIVGKLTISALTTFLFYIFITFVSSVKANIQEPIYMLILVAIGSFAIACIFMAIFDVAVDSLLVCFLVDEQSNSKAIYASADLSELMVK
jgi:choline transporter-like protein 2/4/5